MGNFYEPAEDTFLLLKILQEYLQQKKEKLTICEVGLGSGYISSSLAQEFSNHIYFGSDINPDALKETQVKFDSIKAKIILSNSPFFDGFKENKFDLVFFNTPYLPCEDSEEFEDLELIDKAIYGGKQGNEVILEFISRLNEVLVDNGVCFMLCSSLSQVEEIEQYLNSLLFKFELVEKESHLFEELLIYKIEKTPLLETFSQLGLTQISLFSQGKHSQIYEAQFQEKTVMIKLGKHQHLQKEAMFLDKLKQEDFTSTLLFSGKSYVIYEKIQGVVIEDFLQISSKEDLIQMFNSCLNACFRLDELGITKFEMTNPYKHIFVQENLSIKMIDFERSLFNDNPKNTRQFLQYIRRNIPLLQEKGLELSSEKLLSVGKEYVVGKRFSFEDLLS